MQKTVLKKTALVFFVLIFLCCSLSAQDTNTTRGVIVTSTAPADSTKNNVNTYAMIIGVSRYQHLKSLQYADADAILFRDFLLSPSGGNTKPENIFFLINDSATASNFTTLGYNWLKRKKLKKGDRLYLYFAGHGDAKNQFNYYFLPYDCNPVGDERNYDATANINMHYIKTVLIYEQVQKEVEVFLVMDACRTNQLAGGDEGKKNFQNNMATDMKMGEIMLLSTGPNQFSYEDKKIGNGHGLFTFYLVDGLMGAADKEFTGDNDGKVTVEEIYDYTKGKVKKSAKELFNGEQVPNYCCAENGSKKITTVDTPIYSLWEIKKKLNELIRIDELYAYNEKGNRTRGTGDVNTNDSLQINIYNKFLDALKNGNLLGDSSAETIYYHLENKWPDNSITLDAKYMLAATYLNFCQQKINLFLSGKGLIHIINMGKEVKNENTDNDITGLTSVEEQINELKTIVTTGYDVAKKMMDKAFLLLKDDSDLIQPLIPKYNFINTMAAYANKNSNNTKLSRDVLLLSELVIASDTSSPSGYLLKGWIYQDMENDSCEFYFNKAAAIAPKWSYPINSLGNYYFSKNRYEEAEQFFNNAIQLDSLSVSSYIKKGMIDYNRSGMNYNEQSGMSGMVQEKLKSAENNFRQALKIDSCNTYANEYLGKVMQDYMPLSFGKFSGDSTYFKIAKRFYLRSINCDSSFATGYQRLATLYSRTKNEDSALAILQKYIHQNPTLAEGYRNLGNFYLKTESLHKDTAKAALNFKEAIRLEPLNGTNYYLLARLYKNRNNKNKAIEIYNEAFKITGANKYLYNDIANTYFKSPSQFDSALTYYNKALEIDSTLDYVYYNIALLHTAKGSVKDSTIYYYNRAVLFNPIRWQKLNHTIADYYYDRKEFITAKKYYLNAVSVKTRFFYLDMEKLVHIFIYEKNFEGASKAVNYYINPETEKEKYERLTEIILKAGGNL